MGHMGGVLQISYLIKHGSDAYAMHDALLVAQLTDRHTAFALAQNCKNLEVAISRHLHQNLLRYLAEKILLPHPLSFGGDYPILAQDLPLSKSKIAFARRAIPYSSRWRRKHRSSSSRLAVDKKFGWIIYKTESIATKTSTISSDTQ